MQDVAQEIGFDKVSAVVSDFYDAVQRHGTLSAPFAVVQHWPEHKVHLAHFWWVTLGGKPFRDKPYRVADKHAAAGFTPDLLVDWLALFREVLAQHLSPALAQQWYARAAHIGRSLNLMHEYRSGRQSRAA